MIFNKEKLLRPEANAKIEAIGNRFKLLTIVGQNSFLDDFSITDPLLTTIYQ